MSIDPKNRIFQTLDTLLVEKLRLIKNQKNRFQKIWDKLWDNLPPQVSTISLIKYDSDQFFNSLEYRVQFLSNFKTLTNEIYSLSRDIVENIFNNYFDSKFFKKMFPMEIWVPVILKSAYRVIGSLRDVLTLNPLDISVGYIIAGRFTDYFRYNSLPLSEIAQELQKSGYQIDHEELSETLDQLVSVEFLIAEDATDDEIKYKFNPEFPLDWEFEPYQIYLKPVIEWITGIWQGLFNFRQLNLALDPSYPHMKELEPCLQLAATQGFRSVNALMYKLVEFFNDLDLSETQSVPTKKTITKKKKTTASQKKSTTKKKKTTASQKKSTTIKKKTTASKKKSTTKKKKTTKSKKKSTASKKSATKKK